MDLDDAELETQLRETLHRAAAPVHGEGVFKEAIRNEVARRQSTRQRNRWTGRMALAAAVAAAAAVSVFVLTRPDADRVDIDDSVVTQPTVPPTTAAPSTTPSTTPSSTTPNPTTPSTTPSATPSLPDFPAEAPLGHGEPTWGLYLVVLPEGQASVDSPEFKAAQQAARDAGYSQAEGYSGIGCDEGAAEALGVDPNTAWIAPAVYFASEAQADQARAAFEARGQSVAGIAHVTPYCLD
jgi:hypothetical protein